MAAAAAAAIIAGANAGLMSDYLENTIGIDNIILRSRLVREGFTNNLGFLSTRMTSVHPRLLAPSGSKEE